MTYNAEKKSNIKPTPPQMSSGHVNHLVGERRNGFVINVTHQQNGWRTFNHMVVFRTKLLHFKIENTLTKDTNGKKKFKRMLSFLFVDKRKLFSVNLYFEEFNLVFYMVDWSAWPLLNQPRQQGF